MVIDLLGWQCGLGMRRIVCLEFQVEDLPVPDSHMHAEGPV